MSTNTNSAAARRVRCVAGHLHTVSSFAQGLEAQSVSEVAVDGPSTLRAERAGASFDVRTMTHLLDGGEEITRIKEDYVAMLERDPVLLDPGFYDRTREQARYRVMQKMRRFSEIKPDDPVRSKILNDLIALHDASFSTRLAVHHTLFIGALTGQGTKDLQERYVADARKLRVVGSFAMTEMGHGSAIRHFETTAHFDKATDTFVINTPTLTATKWWIGGVAHISTHTICFARLIIDERDYGVHSFLVQLRDRDGNVMPGITIGDCGKKMGRDGVDNGWIQFNNVRVPRVQMLQKWAKVSREGVYSQPPKAQLAYGALLGGRVSLILNCNDQLKRGLTIAIRYCAVRRQFANKKGPETQILDYQTHQIRLLEPLSGAFAWTFTGRALEAQAAKLQQELANGDLTNLPDLHATSAGLKAISTWYINAALEQARQCMAGHGYSAYSALPTLVSDMGVNCTWEGDNTVMLLQTAQYLVKSISRVFEGKKLVGSARYLERAQEILTQPPLAAGSAQDFENEDLVIQLYERAAIKKIARAARAVQREMKSGKPKEEAFNACLIDLVRASEAHCYLFAVRAFLEQVRAAQAGPIHSVLKKLFLLFCLNRVANVDASTHLGDSWMNEKQLELLNQKVRDLLSAIRKDAVPLVDAFNLPDSLVNSPLGRYDGDLYNHYFKTVRAAPGAEGKAPYWDELVKPCLRKDL